MSENTIYFDNAREMEGVAGADPEVLARIGQAFGVRLAARDAWIRAEGPAEGVTRAGAYFEGLRRARARGIELQSHGRLYALQAFLDGRERELDAVFACRIDVAPSMPPVFPRTFGQYRYVEAIRENDLVLAIGPAGTGKTYLAMAMAVAALLRGEVSRLILARPAVEAGEALGFLPGDFRQKVSPYLRPLHDALYDMMRPEDIERQMERGVIEVAPLAYMRGRTLNHAFVILDEAQNTTEEQMLMLLTRLGFDAKCVVTGDLTQIDLPGGKPSGLREARRLLRGVPGIVVTELQETDVVRHELVQRIVRAYRDGRTTAGDRDEP